MIKAVFLDIDDTVLDFGAFVRSAMQAGFAQFGLPAYTEDMFPVFQRINNALWQRIERGEITRSQLMDLRWPAIFRALGMEGDGRAFELYFRSALLHSAIPVPGAEEMIPWLSRRFILCAASNGPFAQQEYRLRQAGFLPWFHFLFISEALGVSKPEPLFFQRCLDELNSRCPPAEDAKPILPGEILMVGDSLSSDMQGGIGSGLKTCYFNPEGRPVPGDLPLDYTITRLDQLRSILT